MQQNCFKHSKIISNFQFFILKRIIWAKTHFILQVFGQLVSIQSHIGIPSNGVISRVLSVRQNHPYEVSYLGESQTLLTFTIHMYLLHSTQPVPFLSNDSCCYQKVFQHKKYQTYSILRTWFCILSNNKKVRHMVAELDKEEHSKKHISDSVKSTSES